VNKMRAIERVRTRGLVGELDAGESPLP